MLNAAHEEFDRVIGSDRAPTFEDEKDLPYIRAMVKEVNRWRFVNKFGTNHYAMEDGWYKGYFIPKGSVVMINIWGLQYDPKRFPNPETVSSRPESPRDQVSMMRSWKADRTPTVRTHAIL